MPSVQKRGTRPSFNVALPAKEVAAQWVMEAFDDKIVDCKVITLRKVSEALEMAGVVFVEDGVRMTKAASVKAKAHTNP